MRTRLGLLALILLVATTIACLRKQQIATGKTPAVQNVNIEKVTLASVEEFYEATGTVRARTTSVLSSKIIGNVLAMRVREGDRVSVGQVVAEIDNRDAGVQLAKAQAGAREAQEGVEEIERSIRAAEATKKAAEANLALAAVTFNRYKALLSRQSVSQQEFDERQARNSVAEAEVDREAKLLQSLQARRNQVLARIDQAKADINSAQIYSGYARIISPINGVVTAKHADVGFMATPGAPLLTVEDDTSYRLETAVEESRLASINLKDQVTVKIEALGSDDIRGQVAEIVPASDPLSRSYIVKIELPEASRQSYLRLLRSGLYGKARFTTGHKQALAVPQKAVVNRGQLVGVFIIDADGIARLRLVTTGKKFGERVEVLSGINEGERIAVDNVEALSDGSKVN